VILLPLRALENLLRLLFAPLWLLRRRFVPLPAPWVRLELNGRLALLPASVPFWRKWLPNASRFERDSLEEIDALLRRLARDRRRRGLLLEIPRLHAGWGNLAALRAQLVTLKSAGKAIVAHLPEGGGMRELYLASVDGRVITSPQASFELPGIGATSRYLGAAFAKVGLKVEPFAQGRYKTAVESLASEQMSESQREQLEALLEAFDLELRRALSEREALDESSVEALFEAALVSAQEAKERSLVDALGYEDELPTLLDADPKRASVSAELYLEVARAPLFRPLRRRRHLAVVEIHGAITREGRGASQVRLVRQLRAARADKRALGVILDIDSPGGSALASDLIHREVLRLAEKKPVVALFGAVAASGGYYVAAPAHAIVAAATTITGSIGVISARLDASALLERLGVRSHTLRRAPHSDLLDPSRPSTEAERALMDRELHVAYEGFVRRVADGRGLSFDQVHELAQGRVWSGVDAHAHGLVDHLGGLAEVRQVFAERLGLSLERVRALRLVRAKAGRHRPPPAPPPKVEALLRELSPELADLYSLSSGRDRVLYYDPALPRVS